MMLMLIVLYFNIKSRNTIKYKSETSSRNFQGQKGEPGANGKVGFIASFVFSIFHSFVRSFFHKIQDVELLSIN